MKTKGQSTLTMIITGVIVVIAVIAYLFLELPGDIMLGEGELGDAEVAIHIIDVGQGDAIFIDTPDSDILIDAGPGDSADRLLWYLDSIGVYEIDYAFFSHPHEDHIGGGDDIISHYKVNRVVMPDYYENTACYRRLIEGVDFEGADLIYACSGDEFAIGEIKVEVYSPGPRYKPDDANGVSLIMKVSYGEVDAMFTGDAEVHNEEFALNKYADRMDCEILKVGHHGSSTSTSEEFLYAVSPELAVISVGTDNSYGHPHRETMALLNGYMDDIYRTDLHGDIVIGMTKDSYWLVEE